jgi:hypothetical protein
MSLGTGPPAPPPLRKSRWSWWKPVKGTSANDDYYYNVHSNGDSRPGSSSSTIRPGSSSSSKPSKLRKARNSLSALDDKRAEVLRKGVLGYMKDGPPSMTNGASNTTSVSLTRSEEPPPPVQPTTGESNDTDTGSSDPSGSGVPRSKNNRKSTSR